MPRRLRLRICPSKFAKADVTQSGPAPEEEEEEVDTSGVKEEDIEMSCLMPMTPGARKSRL